MHSQLRFSVGTRAEQSVLRDCFYTPPLKLLTLHAHHAIWPTALHAMQMSASPGLLAGDVQEIEIDLETNAALHLSTQSYQRVLSMSAGGVAQQSTVVHIADGARLCYLPHPLVLHAGAQFKQSTEIHMGERAQLLLGEVIASGRQRNGEHFAFAHLSSKIRINYRNRPLVLDNIQWTPTTHHIESIGQMEGFSHLATFYYVNTEPYDIHEKLTQLHELITQWSEQNIKTTMAGVSIAAHGTLHVRGLAQSAEVLFELMQACALLFTTKHVMLPHPAQNSVLVPHHQT